VQLNWAAKSGTQVEFGVQCGIMAAAFLTIVFFLAVLRHEVESRAGSSCFQDKLTEPD
jgi:hypothetical protein